MCVIRMTTGHIGLGGFQAVNETHSYEKVYESIDSGWGNLSLLLFFEACNELVC